MKQNPFNEKTGRELCCVFSLETRAISVDGAHNTEQQ
jgi:hypothetical protein